MFVTSPLSEEVIGFRTHSKELLGILEYLMVERNVVHIIFSMQEHPTLKVVDELETWLKDSGIKKVMFYRDTGGQPSVVLIDRKNPSASVSGFATIE